MSASFVNTVEGGVGGGDTVGRDNEGLWDQGSKGWVLIGLTKQR